MSIEKTVKKDVRELLEIHKAVANTVEGDEAYEKILTKALTQTRIDTLKEVEEWVKENSDRVKVPELGDVEPVDYIASETLLTHIQSLLDKK